jgi:hypothetical protein
MNLTMRKFQSEEDFWRIRTLARKAFLLNNRLERSWSTPRVDYWRWHFIKTVETHPMDQDTIPGTPTGLIGLARFFNWSV